MLVSLPQSQIGNRILAALPAKEYERILPHLEHISFAPDQVVCESGAQMEHIYFLTNSTIYLLYVVESGATAEIGIIGNEGVLGIALFMGDDATPYRAVVQTGGGALRMKAQALREEFARGGEFQRLLLRYTQSLMIQISQTAVCNRLHTVEQQLCRLLLLSHDRGRSDELLMTQELIANMLGVRREGVTHAARQLRKEGFIRYIRGHIEILDRRGLEANACECYQVVENEFDRLFGQRSKRPNQVGRALQAADGRDLPEPLQKVSLG
jgi:CRP-like cAMP-binding protein